MVRHVVHNDASHFWRWTVATAVAGFALTACAQAESRKLETDGNVGTIGSSGRTEGAASEGMPASGSANAGVERSGGAGMATSGLGDDGDSNSSGSVASADASIADGSWPVDGSSGSADGSGERMDATGTPGSGDAASVDGGDGRCAAAPGTVTGVFTDPVGAATISPPNPPGITFKDTDGNLVNAHDGGIIKVCDTYYLHGEYFLSTTTDNNFHGFSMYSSRDLATWKNEGFILPEQSSGQLGPNRKAERPHIIQCPSTGEFVLFAHSDDVTYQADKEIIYATSPTVNGIYAFKGSLLNASGAIAAHNDMSAFVDGKDVYVVTEGGWVYTIASDCHSWVSSKQYSAVNGTVGGAEAPTVFKAGATYYWIASDKTGWRANDNFYATASAMSGPWTARGYLAPQGKLTWMSQTTWVEPIQGSAGTVYLFIGDHWYGTQDTTAPGKYNYLATYVFQPLVFTGTAISLPTYEASWKLDVGAGSWSN